MADNVQLNLLASRFHNAGIEALEDVAALILDEAKHKIGVGDPAVDPNPAVALAESGRIERHGDGLVIIFDTPYAAKQHEDQRLQHPRGGGPKYLEHAVAEIVPALANLVASKVDARMAKGLSSDPQRPHR
jgi:hypothetical protein